MHTQCKYICSLFCGFPVADKSKFLLKYTKCQLANEWKWNHSQQCPVLSRPVLSFCLWQCDNERWTEATKDNTACEISFISQRPHSPARIFPSVSEIARHNVANYWFPFRFRTHTHPFLHETTKQNHICSIQLLFKITTDTNITVNCCSQYFPFHRLN